MTFRIIPARHYGIGFMFSTCGFCIGLFFWLLLVAFGAMGVAISRYDAILGAWRWI
jgi:lipopolysaccharide export LptBFGC system permease protein LptF